MKYPTDRRGLATSPYILGYTYPTGSDLRYRRTQNHHLYFPRREYQEPMHRIFRNLLQNIYPMLAEEHNGIDSLHDTYAPPRMPRDVVMLDIIEEEIATAGVLTLIREKSTNTIYQISEERWEQIYGQ
jgi:hypothetical protein